MTHRGGTDADGGARPVEKNPHADAVLAREISDDPGVVQPREGLAGGGAGDAQSLTQHGPGFDVIPFPRLGLEAQHPLSLPEPRGGVDQPEVYLAHERRHLVGLRGGDGRDDLRVQLEKVFMIFVRRELRLANESVGEIGLRCHSGFPNFLLDSS